MCYNFSISRRKNCTYLLVQKPGRILGINPHTALIRKVLHNRYNKPKPYFLGIEWVIKI